MYILKSFTPVIPTSFSAKLFVDTDNAEGSH